uniref:BTB domain-containing protein n=1 Tax=Parastrongyloides trichosuri TaxID=131310 RepID=A0A0N4Z468_PARTI
MSDYVDSNFINRLPLTDPIPYLEEFRKLLLTMHYEDGIFMCAANQQCYGNKLVLSLFSNVIKAAILDTSNDSNANIIKIETISEYEFKVFKYFVYQNEFLPAEDMCLYYELSHVFKSEFLLEAVYRYVSKEKDDLDELLNFLRVQFLRQDKGLLQVILSARKISLEKLRTSTTVMLMEMEQLQRIDYKALIKSWNCLDALTFIECWIHGDYSKRSVYKGMLYCNVDLSTFDTHGVLTLPSNIFYNIINLCKAEEQLSYVQQFKNLRAGIYSYKEKNNTYGLYHCDIDYFRCHNIKKLTMEKGDGPWFEFVINWFSFNEAVNIKYLPEMLNYLDFTKLDRSFVERWIENNPTIKNNKDVYRFFINKIYGFKYIMDNYSINQYGNALNNDDVSVLKRNGIESTSQISNDGMFGESTQMPNMYIEEETEIYGNNLSKDTVFAKYLSDDTNSTIECDKLYADIDIKEMRNVSEVSCSTSSEEKIYYGPEVAVSQLNNNVDEVEDDVFIEAKEDQKVKSKICPKRNVSVKRVSTQSLPEPELYGNRRARRSANQSLRSKKDSVQSETKMPIFRSKKRSTEDVKVLMVGGESGISKEELKPARNLFYSSIKGEYEYFAELNRDRTLTKICKYEDNLFAVGGKNYVNNKWDSALELLLYNKEKNAWIEMDVCLDYDRAEHDISVINDKMYIIGGNIEKEDKYGVLMYDFNTERFTPIESSSNEIVYQHTNIVKNNAIYIVGGYKGNQTKLIQFFDPRIGRFELLPTPVCSHLQSATVLYNDIIYCVGGRKGSKSTSNPSSNLDFFDIRSGKWGSLAQLPTARYACGGSIIDDEIYVFGGACKNGGTLKIVEKYDIQSDRWYPVRSSMDLFFNTSSSKYSENFDVSTDMKEDNLFSKELSSKDTFMALTPPMSSFDRSPPNEDTEYKKSETYDFHKSFMSTNIMDNNNSTFDSFLTLLQKNLYANNTNVENRNNVYENNFKLFEDITNDFPNNNSINNLTSQYRISFIQNMLSVMMSNQMITSNETSTNNIQPQLFIPTQNDLSSIINNGQILNKLTKEQELSLLKISSNQKPVKKVQSNRLLLSQNSEINDEKPYKCDYHNCFKTFANKHLLKKHQFTHTGIRPHGCTFCGKRFSRRDNCLRHERSHINEFARLF